MLPLHKCENPTCNNMTERPKFCSRKCAMQVTNRIYRKTYRERNGIGLTTAYQREHKPTPKTDQPHPCIYHGAHGKLVVVDTHQRAEALRQAA